MTPDGRAWRDVAGGVGLGTSGSGDVLAAGDRLAARLGRLGFVARELLGELGPVLASLST